MFTGIVQGLAQVAGITDRPGLRSFELAFPPGFDAGLEIGASVACDGVCLTVTALPGPGRDITVAAGKRRRKRDSCSARCE